MTAPLDDVDDQAEDERGPVTPDAPTRPDVRAAGDVFVKVSDSQLVLYHAGDRLAAKHVDLPQVPAARDESGAYVAKKSRRRS